MSDVFNLNPIQLKAETKTSNNSILVSNQMIESRQGEGLLKTTYPIYLYKPPFGYPRNVNVVFLRELAKNPYVFAVIKAITDQAAETKWEIKLKEGVEMTPELEEAQKFITEFFKNPNSDNESFAQLLRKIIPDLLVLDSAVLNKVYNKNGDLVQLRAVDGAAILKNPDQYGSLYNRADYIDAEGYFGIGSNSSNAVKPSKTYKLAVDQYSAYGYNEEAAYFQFAYGINYSVPIPFGKKEIIYMMENPSTETVYSRGSALQSAIDITLNLIYSSKASLDLFLNANIPSGIIQLAEAGQDDVDIFQKKLYNQQYSGFDEYGFQRKINGKLPVVGNPNVSFVPLNFNNKDNQLLEIQQWFTKVLWSCMGITASEMGFTQGDSRATDESQAKVSAKKAVKPRLSLIGNYLNDQIMPELPNGDLFEFSFDEYDIDQEIKKWQLYQTKITTGVVTAEQIADIEGIDYVKQDSRDRFTEEEEKPQQEEKSLTTDSGGQGITDTPLVPVEHTKKKKKEKIQDTTNELKSAYDLGNKFVITGDSKEELLKQAIEFIENNKEEKEESDNVKDWVYDGAEEYKESQDRLITGEEELKSKKETPLEKVINEYVKELEKEAKEIIDSKEE
jgi:phage portal protein BeeE